MRRKPWPIILLALFYLLIPLFNILAASIRYRDELQFVPLLKILFLDPNNKMSLFNMIVPSLIASYAVYKVKKWSFPVVFICTAWLSVTTIKDYSNSMDTWSIFIGIILPILINLILSSYILLPNVYRYYTNAMLRWWERENRYIYQTPVSIELDGEKFAFELENISKGGCLVKNVLDVNFEKPFLIKLNVLDNPLEIKAIVGHKRLTTNSWVYGLKFIELEKTQKRELKNIISQFKKMNSPIANPPPHWKEDFLNWLKGILPKAT
jgi:hypothetical protein